MHLNDCILEALRQSTTGRQINDALLQYFLNNGATTPTIGDAEQEFLAAQGHDSWFTFLRSRGYTGTVTDMLHTFWCVDGGVMASLCVEKCSSANWWGYSADPNPDPPACVFGSFDGEISAGTLTHLFAGAGVQVRARIAEGYVGEQLSVTVNGVQADMSWDETAQDYWVFDDPLSVAIRDAEGSCVSVSVNSNNVWCPIELHADWAIVDGTGPSGICMDETTATFSQEVADPGILRVANTSLGSFADGRIDFTLANRFDVAAETGIGGRITGVNGVWARYQLGALEVVERSDTGWSQILTIPGADLPSDDISLVMVGSQVQILSGGQTWSATTSVTASGQWGLIVAQNGSTTLPVDLFSNVSLQQVTGNAPLLTSARAYQVELGGKRYHRVALVFDQPVLCDNAVGLALTANGANRLLSYSSGSGSDTLVFSSQRIIFQNTLEVAYDGTGSIRSADTGIPAAAFGATGVTNQLPVFTLWDGIPAGSAIENTLWDSVDDNTETKYDEE